jgi:hypothetical protein
MVGPLAVRYPVMSSFEGAARMGDEGQSRWLPPAALPPADSKLLRCLRFECG